MASIRFLGAAGEVTGSCFLVEAGKARFLVDCGMFQGGALSERRNRRFAFDPKDIAFVVLTHAHIDHSGLLPRLAAGGFKGPIYATAATHELLSIMLPDSGHLQEREAARERRTPLYGVAEAQACLAQLRPADYGAAFEPGAGIRCVLRDAGHILGSAIAEVFLPGAKLVFSGDLGQPGRPILENPSVIEEADVLLVESTYGDRNHKSLVQTLDELAFALNDTLASRRGNVVIPSFAVGRTQEILYYIAELERAGRVPAATVYVDSPMASAATRITMRHARFPFPKNVVFTDTLEESMRINRVTSGAIIVSASGMCDGGRIRHHLRYNIDRPECSIVIAGFQAARTLGRRIVDGAKSVKLFGETHAVKARVFTINGLSAHADRDALLGWLAGFRRPPRQTWVVHGEIQAAASLRDAIEAKPGWRAALPDFGQVAPV